MSGHVSTGSCWWPLRSRCSPRFFGTVVTKRSANPPD